MENRYTPKFEEAAPRKLKSIRDHAINSYAMRLKELLAKYGKRKFADDIAFEVEELLHTILDKDNIIDDQFIVDSLRKMNKRVSNGKIEL